MSPFKKTPPPRRPPGPVLTRPLPKKNPFPWYLLVIALFSFWFVWRSLTPVLPRLGEPPRLYANPSREDLRLTLLKAIRRTDRSIYLAMFGLTDPAILKALAEKIEQKIPTAVYYDPSGSGNVRNSLRGAEVHPVFQSGFMHQKILILDDETVFLGSANFTTQSLKMHDNLVIGLVSPKVARFLKENTPHSSGYLRTLVGGQDVEIWLLPDPKGHALADLKKRLRNARSSLRVALFTLTHSALTEELIRAKKRGVDVTVLIDLHSALGASASSVEELHKSGVRVLYSQGVQLLHHKFVYIDEQTLVAGSANWTKAAFAKNSDCLFVLHNLDQDQKTFMNSLWHRLETNGKERPPCFRGEFPLP